MVPEEKKVIVFTEENPYTEKDLTNTMEHPEESEDDEEGGAASVTDASSRIQPADGGGTS